ncbi:NAD(P)-binding protein [Panus rudis PR-1116 ss-1]|nr:NAD(P)-binding protein [Panus rudis PR-1116 ss-1]
MSSPKVWLITGTSSGLGRAVAEYVLSQGDIVVATARRPETLDALREQYPSKSQLLVLKLDVTNNEEILSVFEDIRKTYGRLDVLYNNAAYSLLGEVEATPLDVGQKLFATNFWGAATVMREAVRFFREVNKPGVGGRIINASSMSGIQGMPGIGYYGASKYALEGLCDSLALELDPEWNIKITSVVLGEFRTKGVSNSVKLPAHPAYTKPNIGRNQVLKVFGKPDMPDGQDPYKAAVQIYKLAYLARPPLRIPLGTGAVAFAKAKSAHFAEIVEKYGCWTDELD